MSGCKVISVINWKGGVGKTTIAHHLGTGFFHLSDKERQKYLGSKELPRVLLVDNDAQCNLSVSCLGADEYEDIVYNKKLGTIKDLYIPFLKEDEVDIDVKPAVLKWHVKKDASSTYPTVDLFPAHQDLIFTDMNIAVFKRASFEASLRGSSDLYKFRILDRIFEQLRDDYDFIIIDCPPNLNYITQNAIYASDYYLIPTLLDVLSTYGISTIIEKINSLNNWFLDLSPDFRPAELIGIVPNSVREYGQEPKGSQAYIMDRLQENFGDMVFQNYLTYGDGIAKASQLGQPVYSSKGNAQKQADTMLAVLCEMMERL